VKDDGVYLDNILECIGRVQRYTADRREAFFTDEMTQDAVLRNLQILAESCGRLPREIRDRRREIDWKGIAGFRNVVVHDYLDLNLEKVWEIIQVELPPLAIVMGEELARIDADLRELNREGST
jgi:uncharacterized protein with HEPN domain